MRTPVFFDQLVSSKNSLPNHYKFSVDSSYNQKQQQHASPRIIPLNLNNGPNSIVKMKTFVTSNNSNSITTTITTTDYLKKSSSSSCAAVPKMYSFNSPNQCCNKNDFYQENKLMHNMQKKYVSYWRIIFCKFDRKPVGYFKIL